MATGTAAVVRRVPAIIVAAFASAAQAGPVYVTYLWHMHQPVYYPYETVQQTDANGRFTFSVTDVHNQRTGPYTTWPRDAVQAGADRGMPHAGVQCSFSGSLGENLSGLWGAPAGQSWDDAYAWGRNHLLTVRGNPRLDLVGFPYHHSLMPLTCHASMRMQIRLHKEIYRELWDTTGYSKGFFPPETAFAEWIIPALADEGIEWVLVDNVHSDRACEGYPWEAGGNILRPNRADTQNPDPGTWIRLHGLWTGTMVSAPWGYQPHYVQYVDPWSDPDDPEVYRIIAVPAARYEGNENTRGGYGAFKPENVWTEYLDRNTDPEHPMLVVCHSDGDNHGMLNWSVYHDSHDAFLTMCGGNPAFDTTTIQDYLELYPPHPDDIVHVEPGSWAGADSGDPQFKKWNGDPWPDGRSPDRFSWSVLVATQNRVLHADDLEGEGHYTIDDVRKGTGHETARGWHYYLNAEASDYWYWDGDTTNPWDGNATRACNLAVVQADKVIARHPGADGVGPAIYPPQRTPYNPGGRHWNESTPQPSDFAIWTFAYDVSGLAAVRLYWRTDKDGANPVSSFDNELYAGGDEVNDWNVEDITSSARWMPANPGPAHIVPAPAYRARAYSGRIEDQSDVLIDYFVEAIDATGNVSRSEIMHVYVGDAGGVTPGGPASFLPSQPNGCINTVVRYAKAGSLLGAAPQLYIHIGRNGWQNILRPDPPMTDCGDAWEYVYDAPAGTTQIDCVFNDGAGTWDNNNWADWHAVVNGCYDDVDSDNDDIPDGWELDHFQNLTTATKTSDWDDDGMKDRYEAIAGTSPKDPGSSLRITSLDGDLAAGGTFILRWGSVSGKMYTVCAMPSLDMPPGPVENRVLGTPPENVYTGSLATADARFYMIGTE